MLSACDGATFHPIDPAPSVALLSMIVAFWRSADCNPNRQSSIINHQSPITNPNQSSIINHQCNAIA